jgi:hypothetical protein
VMLGVSTSDVGMGIASAVLDHETYRDTINHIGDGDSSLGEVRLCARSCQRCSLCDALRPPRSQLALGEYLC